MAEVTMSDIGATPKGSQQVNSTDAVDYLKHISEGIDKLLQNGMPSQSDAKQAKSEFGDFRKPLTGRSMKQSADRAKSSFTDGFEEALWEGLLGSDFKDKIGKTLNDFADQIGVSIEDIPGTIGKELGKQAMSAFKGTKLGKAASSSMDKLVNSAMSNLKSSFMSGVSKYDSAKGTQFAAQFASKAATEGAEALATGGTEAATALAASAEGATAAGAAASGVAAAAATLAPIVIGVAAAFVILGPAVQGLGKLFSSLGSAALRDHDAQKKNMEAAQARMQADVETIIKEPFNLLQEAAQKVYDAWDANLRLISGTQGYTKADLQALMAEYATRLRDEGLSDVISVADITDSLGSVLKSGLSGTVATEFAYMATMLNAAIPSQDFFGYASTYASLAANQIRLGKSQEEAIQYADEQLKDFASNVLYSSRQLAGGFSTGLKDAQTLFEESVKIAQAAKTGNASQISGVLTAVAAITGSMAPDLATSVIDAIYKSATGGNASELVALRSLAGINASNTEFLQAFAKNPQAIFTKVFRSLATYQNMSPSAFMEVAEGVSSVFGLSMDSFSRIDFNYLADAVANMNVNNASLDENMSLLAAGQTTTTKEMQKIAQINEYLIDEGLSYVLDNEVARSIQQHMWDEQLAREMQAATYGIEIKGAAMEALQGIMQTVDNLLMFLMPWKAIPNLIGNIAKSSAEAKALDEDIKQVLQLGKVGTGNARELYQLTTRNKDLMLTTSLVELMGGTSAYKAAGAKWDSYKQIAAAVIGGALGITGATAILPSTLKYGRAALPASRTTITPANSLYSWGTVSKSGAVALGAFAESLSKYSNPASAARVLATSANLGSSAVSSKIDQMLASSYIGERFALAGKSYNDFVASAKNLGISDFSQAVKDAGYAEQDIKNLFQQYQTQQGLQEQAQRNQTESEYWDTMIKYVPDMYNHLFEGADAFQPRVDTLLTDLIAKVVEGNSHLILLDKNVDSFWTNWNNYILEHTVYNKAYTFGDVESIYRQQADKDKEDVAYALSEALTRGLSGDIEALKDPTVQTNVLLSQILIVMRAIMEQGNKTGGTSMIDSLTAMALGLTSST